MSVNTNFPYIAPRTPDEYCRICQKMVCSNIRYGVGCTIYYCPECGHQLDIEFFDDEYGD